MLAKVVEQANKGARAVGGGGLAWSKPQWRVSQLGRGQLGIGQGPTTGGARFMALSSASGAETANKAGEKGAASSATTNTQLGAASPKPKAGEGEEEDATPGAGNAAGVAFSDVLIFLGLSAASFGFMLNTIS